MLLRVCFSVCAAFLVLCGRVVYFSSSVVGTSVLRCALSDLADLVSSLCVVRACVSEVLPSLLF